MTVFSSTNTQGFLEYKTTMPADVSSYLYGVSPPFYSSFSSTLTTTVSKVDTLSPYSVFSTSKLNLSPCFKRKSLNKSLKPCIKPSLTDSGAKNTLQSQKQDTSLSEFAISYSEENESKLKKEKRVTFADSHGRSLTSVKFVTESTNEPPKCITSGEFFQRFKNKLNLSSNQDDKDDNTNKPPKFVLKFAQPISNYIRFKQLLEKKNVCLENVVVKENHTLHGTVKVKNLTFEKKVVVRLTCDNWMSSKDYDCQYVKDAYENGAFDTFQFSITIPPINPDVAFLEFCVNFSCAKGNYWDNYDGLNYQISVSDVEKRKEVQTASFPSVIKSIPSTYNELPGPQFNSWGVWEGAGPFY